MENGYFTDPTDPGHTHDYSEAVETAEATCVAKAYTIYQCSCGDTKKVENGSVDPDNHVGKIKIYGPHDATDTLDGYTDDKVCAACGKVVEAGSVIPHTGSTTPDTPTNPDTPDDGGSSGSTAGGVKTTTLAVGLLYMAAGLRGVKKPAVFGRTVSGDTGKKALCVLMFNFLLAFAGTIVISAAQDLPAKDVIYETSSAVGTVGITTGVTRDLAVVSRLTIIFLMYCGRAGSTSFALALFEKRAEPPVTFPEEDVSVG